MTALTQTQIDSRTALLVALPVAQLTPYMTEVARWLAQTDMTLQRAEAFLERIAQSTGADRQARREELSAAMKAVCGVKAQPAAASPPPAPGSREARVAELRGHAKAVSRR